MRALRSKRFLIPFTAFIAAGASAAIAISASTPSSQQVIVDTTAVHMRVVKQTLDNYDSGWHIHPGLVFVKVHEGSLQFYEDGCTPKTVSAGEFTIEPPYEPVRVIATHAVETVAYLLNAPDPVLVPLNVYSPGYNPCPSLP
jgi:quercetin dioxygenase-like cupin family protein